MLRSAFAISLRFLLWTGGRKVRRYNRRSFLKHAGLLRNGEAVVETVAQI